MSGDVVLVTGGTGVVGTSLIAELRGEETVACLVHRTPLEDATDTVERVQGDLTEPNLGLDRSAWRELAQRVRAVVHCAAMVAFSAKPEAINQLNVSGTEHILEFAAEAEAPIFYTSSAFVDRTEMLEDDEAEAGITGGMRDYLRSKQVAEELVRSSGLPYAIVRPPLLFSDTRTGLITREQAVHKVLRGVAKGTLPFVPWGAESRIDFVPQDLLGKAITSLVRHGSADGSEYWATAGREALSADQINRVCVETMARHGIEVDPRPMFDVEMVKRLIVPAFLTEFGKRDQRRFRELISFASLFGTAEPLPCNWDEIPGRPHHPTNEELRDVLALTVERKFVPRTKRTRKLAEAS